MSTLPHTEVRTISRSLSRRNDLLKRPDRHRKGSDSEGSEVGTRDAEEDALDKLVFGESIDYRASLVKNGEAESAIQGEEAAELDELEDAQVWLPILGRYGY